MPNERYPHILEGRLKRLLGRPEEAVLAYERALSCEGGEIVEPQLRALYEELGRQADLARLRHRRAQQAPSLDRFAAESYIRQGEPARAAEQAALIVERDPANLELRVWQARLLKTIGRTDEAEKTLKDLVEREPEQLGPRIALLYFLVGVQKHEEARSLIESIGKEVPHLSRPEFVLAQCWSIAGETDRARSAFETSLSRWPDDSRVLIESVRFHDSHNDVARAEALLRAFLSRHSDQRWAGRALAMLRSGHRGDMTAWREAWDLCKPVPRHADEPDDLLTRAIVLSRSPEGDGRAEAAALLEQLLLRLPSDLSSASQARRLLIALDLQLGRPAQAAKVAGVEASQQTSPESLRLHVETLVAAGSLAEAERQLAHLEKVQTGNPINVLLRARLLAEQEQPTQAARLLESQARLWIEDEQAPEEHRGQVREAVRILMTMNQFSAAERVARKLAEKSPQDRSLVGVVLVREKRLEEAVQTLLESIPTARPESDREIVHSLVYACRQRPDDLKSLELAIQGVNTILEREPTDASLRVSQAALCHLKKDYAREVALYQEALKLNPVDRSFLNNLAWVLSEELNRPAEGLPLVNQALNESKQARPDILDTRGVIYTRMNKTEEAIRDLERATEALPNPLMLAHLARAYYRAGQMDKYRTARERALNAGLTPEMLQPSERQELGPLLFDNQRTS